MIRSTMLTLAMVAVVTGCEAGNIGQLFGQGVVGGTGATVGSAIANFLLGLVGLAA